MRRDPLTLFFGALAAFAVGVVLLRPVALAQQGSTPETPPNQVRLLLDLLADPSVRDWLEKYPRSEPSRDGQPTAEMMSPNYVAGRIDALRQNIGASTAALSRLPEELGQARNTLAREINERGAVAILFMIAAVIGLGFAGEWIISRAVQRGRSLTVTSPSQNGQERLRASATRLAYDIVSVAVFAVISIGAFLAFDWSPHIKVVVLGYLMAFIALRVIIVASRFVLAPGASELAEQSAFRVLPMRDEAARFWHARICALAGWFAFGFITVRLLDTLDVSLDGRRVVAYALTLGLLAIGVEAACRRPDAISGQGAQRFGRGIRNALLAAYFIFLWVLWVLAAPPRPGFWLVAMAGLLPFTVVILRRAVDSLLHPGAARAAARTPSLATVAVDRGMLAVLVVAAVLFLAGKFEVDLAAMTAQDSLATRVVRGAFSAVMIVLVADVAWHLLKAALDRKLSDAAGSDQTDAEDVRRRQRLKTLLPIVRNVVFITLLIIVLLTVLSAFGVEIGPLIAGAGVVGVAIGFGAQTLVKDIISGMFYLLDDAFRIGEYIQSDKFKGTVESFSLRSIKLRHHRGYLYIVPFGELGAIQNMSRDWVIDKLTIGVTYDSDLDKAKKLIKEIGRDLAKDPDYAPKIIEPLKMQGVERFGDYAVELRLKMKTKPGEQFVIRRRAYALIKKAFDAEGIKFAFPTVQVAGGEEPSPAIAKRALDLIEPPPAAP